MPATCRPRVEDADRGGGDFAAHASIPAIALDIETSRHAEQLHPYVLTSHIRDTAVWRVAEARPFAGPAWEKATWTSKAIRKYRNWPGKALSLEIMSPHVAISIQVSEGYRNVPPGSSAVRHRREGQAHTCSFQSRDQAARERET